MGFNYLSAFMWHPLVMLTNFFVLDFYQLTIGTATMSSTSTLLYRIRVSIYNDVLAFCQFSWICQFSL